MNNKITVTLQAEISTYLYNQINKFLERGDFLDMDDFVNVAIASFMDDYDTWKLKNNEENNI
jgi:hypothetical protein